MQRFEQLDEDAKLTIAFIAMHLRNKKEVKPLLPSFMGIQNQRMQLQNMQNHTYIKLPFVDYKQLGTPTTLDVVVKWTLEFKVSIVNPPKVVNGKLRLFANHIKAK